MTYIHRAVLYFDGASRSNPYGPAGCGFVVQEMDDYGADGEVVAEGYEFLGYNVSNNQAEYYGLISGLSFIQDSLEVDMLYIRGDSEIIINHLTGAYQVRSHNLRPLYDEAMEILQYGDLSGCQWSVKHVYRDRNTDSDWLANYAIDNQASGLDWWPQYQY